MSTAVEIPTETEALAAPVTFVSSCTDLRVVRRQQNRRYGPNGEEIGLTEGEVIEFKNGRYQSDDLAIVEFLRSRPTNGSVFHELGLGADGKPSDSTPQLVKEIFQLAFAGKITEITDLYLAEQQSMSRPEILAACTEAMEQIEAQRAGGTAELEGGDPEPEPEAF